MKIDLKEVSLQIIFKFICIELLGVLFIGDFIFDTANTMFTYTIFGVSTIVFYHIIKKWGVSDFLLAGSVYSVIVIVIFMPTTIVIGLFRNVMWFVSIGAMNYGGYKLESKKQFNDSNLKQFGYWFAAFIAVYLFMLCLNLYVFGLYRIDEYETAFMYFRQAIKIGGVLGIGTGIGIIFQKRFTNWQEKSGKK